MKRFAALFQIFILCLMLAACPAQQTPTVVPAPPTATPTAAVPTPTPRPTDLVGTATRAGNFTTLVTALQAADLVEKLQSPGPFTLFAPTDQAFSLFDPDLLNNKQALFDVLLYHVAATQVISNSLTDGATLKTLLGDSLTIHKEGKTVKVNDAQLTGETLQATNGVIYVIDKVLLPPAKAVASAPNVTINEILARDKRFATLVTGLKATGVYTELQGVGPFTVFAPIQEAFTALPTPLVNNLFKSNQVWPRVLHYHIIAGKKIMAADITNQAVEQTEEGSTVVFSVEADGTLLVQDAKLVQTDIQAANGVIHVIDKVLVPPLD